MFSPACKSVLITLVSPSDDTQEAAFNQYYEEVHIPDVLETPGVIGAQRFVCVDKPDMGKYLTIFESESLEPQDILDRVQATLSKKQHLAGHSFAQATEKLRGSYRRRWRLEDHSRPPKSVTGVLVSFYFGPKDPSQIPLVHHWYNAIHVPDMLAVPGFCATDRLDGVDPQGEYRMLHLYQLDSEDISETIEEMRRRVGRWMVDGRMQMTASFKRRFTRLFQRRMPFSISAVP